MKCIYCDEGSTKVVDTRESSQKVRRRRECKNCGRRFTTYETAESMEIEVTKRGGENETFSEEKIRNGVQRASKKTSLGEDQIEEVVESVKNKIRGKKCVKASEIGEFVKEELKKRDKVAYIRFASVYDSFDDVESFEKEVKALQNDN
jgi:transcriptional repressor NrdR